MNGSSPKQSAHDLLTEAHPALVGLSHWIHANPELGYEETLAAGWVAEWLTTAGFEVRTGIAGMDTALSGSFGPGPFHVVICAEYDALPSVGHACGHNVIAAASVGAAIALACVAEQLGLRVTLLGTPAEEGGGGKLQLIKAGVFDGVHAALMVHPGPEDVAQPQIIAVQQIEVAYTGREAHASAYPEEGVNAADAMVIAQAAIGLLRQQLQTGDRVHGIVTGGGEAPNIIPAHTTARYMTRAATRERLVELTTRVRRCFEAGAIATGAELSFEEGVAYAQMVHDPDLLAHYVTNAEALGRVFDPKATLIASTDMGDVSHVVPSIHPIIGIHSRPAVNHQPDFATAAVSEAADQAIFDGALALAWTVIDVAQDVALRDRLTGNTVAPAVEDAEEAQPATEDVPEIVDAFVVVEEYLADPWAVPAEVADPWALPAAEVADPRALPAAEPIAEVEAQPAAELADPWALPAAGTADPWALPAADAEARPTADLADSWAETAAATYGWAEPTTETIAEHESATSGPTVADELEFSTMSSDTDVVAEAGEAAPDEGYEFGQTFEYQPAEPIADTETPAEPATDSVAEMEWVTDPVIEPVVETGHVYSWFQPTTTDATTYEPATEAPSAQPTQDTWIEPATEAVAESTAESVENAWGHPPAEVVAESEPIAEPEPVYEWMQPTETENEPVEAVAEAQPTEAVAEAEPVEAEPVEAVAEAEPVTDAEPVAEAAAPESVEAVADADPSEAFAEFAFESESQPVQSESQPAAVAESTESSSEYAWMQPVEAVAEDVDPGSENVEAVAEFVAVAEAEPAAEAEPVEPAAELDGTPFDTWAQQSAEQPYLNGHVDEAQSETAGQAADPWADAWTQPGDDAWAEPVAEATDQPVSDAWTTPADAWAEPVAEATDQPVADAWTTPAADDWGDPVAEIHAESHDGNGNGNGNGNGHAWHEAPAEVAPVEAEAEPVDEPARSWSAEHSSWETAFADALAEVEAKPAALEAWSSTASSEDAPRWGGAEAQSWDEAARVD